jgi:hypothetical protein
MTSHIRQLAHVGALALLVLFVVLGAPAGTPAQSTEDQTAVPPTETAVPPTTTPVPTETAVPPSDTPTAAPTETAVPPETPTPIASTAPEPSSEPATSTAAPAAPTATSRAAGVTTPIEPANHTATISPTRTTVNAVVHFTLANFPANANVQIFWQRNTGSVFQFSSTTTDASGAATGTFRVPAVTGGPDQVIAFVAGNKAKRVRIEIRPRIKVLTNPAMCGQTANVSLRGYGKHETVRIRWKVGDSWVQLATVETSNTGSANVDVTVPSSATSGPNSVRGDGTIFRQQTNSAVVECGTTT